MEPVPSNLNAVPTPTGQVRILIADSHPLIRAGLRMLFEKHPGFELAGESDNRAGAVALAEKECPHIILMDLDLGGESGLDFLGKLLQVTQCQSRVILFTGDRDSHKHAQAVRLGALGVVLKDQPPEVLLQAIRKVHQGEVWLERNMVAKALTSLWQHQQPKPVNPEVQKIESLTEREREVIELISKGLKNQQIADTLFISEPTVRRHLSSIFAKLDVADRLELLVYAFQQGIVTPPSQS